MNTQAENQHQLKRAFICFFGTMTKNQPNRRVKRLDDFIYGIETPLEIMRERNKWLKVVRCQIACQEGYRPQYIMLLGFNS
jgi:hypothetical protein